VKGKWAGINHVVDENDFAIFQTGRSEIGIAGPDAAEFIAGAVDFDLAQLRPAFALCFDSIGDALGQ
jgi:hypothetical protein